MRRETLAGSEARGIVEPPVRRFAWMLAGVAAGAVCLAACTGAASQENAAVNRQGTESVLAGGPLHYDSPVDDCVPPVLRWCVRLA